MLFFILFAIFVAIGLPIAFSMGVAGLTFFSISDIPLTAVAQKILGGVDSFTLLAIPLYVLAGEMMETGGVSRRILGLAAALVGHIRGGLGHVVVVATVFMSGISGSSSADTAAIGSSMIPTMMRKGYTREKATALIAASGGMDILVPPCITMIVLGGVVNLSVSNLFFAGIMPGILMAIALMIVIYLEAKKANIPFEPRQSSSQLVTAFREAIWALLIPVIILGGIKIGAFTATEGAVVAVVYSGIISMFVYKEVKLKDFIHIGIKAITTTGAIMFLIGMSALFAWVTAREQVPDVIMKWVIDFSENPYVFLLLTNLVVLIFGAVLEGAPAVIILAPLLMPVAVKLGIDPIHFGTLMIANIGVGYLLPPIGICLLIACSVGKVRVVDIIKPITPYFIAMVIALMLITYVPEVSLFIPKLFGYQPLR